MPAPAIWFQIIPLRSPLKEYALANIGLIGLGLVGQALAERMLNAGHHLVGFDIDPGRCGEFAQLGGHVTENARAVAMQSDCFVMSLPTSAIAASVLQEATANLTGKTVIDTTTGDPELSAAMGRALHDQGISYLDTTIVGSSKQVRAGDVIVLAGGDEVAFHHSLPLLSCFARQCFYLGPWGSGTRMKLVVNLVLGLNRAALAEGLSFAQACGIEASRALEVLRSGVSYSRVMDTKGPKMVAHDFSAEAKLSQHHKDVGLILAAAQRVGAYVPLSVVHDQLLSTAESAGLGQDDNSAIIKVFKSLADRRSNQSDGEY